MNKLSINKAIRIKNEDVVTNAENLMQTLQDLEFYAKENNKPFKFYFVFRKDLQAFTNRFKRMTK